MVDITLLFSQPIPQLPDLSWLSSLPPSSSHDCSHIPLVMQSFNIHIPLKSSKIYDTVNQQILAAIKFGVSQNKVIWQLLNLVSPRLCGVRSTYDHVFWRDKC